MNGVSVDTVLFLIKFCLDKDKEKIKQLQNDLNIERAAHRITKRKLNLNNNEQR